MSLSLSPSQIPNILHLSGQWCVFTYVVRREEAALTDLQWSVHTKLATSHDNKIDPQERFSSTFFPEKDKNFNKTQKTWKTLNLFSQSGVTGYAAKSLMVKPVFRPLFLFVTSFSSTWNRFYCSLCTWFWHWLGTRQVDSQPKNSNLSLT